MFEKVVIAGVIIEALVQTVRWVIEDEGTNRANLGYRVFALVASIGLAALAQLDLLAEAGLVIEVPYVGAVLTGFLFARGATVLHDLWSRIHGGGA